MDTTIDYSIKLFVGQVPHTYEEKDIEPFFEKYGTLVNTRIVRDKDTKKHKGCAFVTFQNLDDAEVAIKEMHDKVKLESAKKEMQIKPVNNDDAVKLTKRLFVGMISKNLDSDNLRDMFTPFGEIVDCNILIDRTENKSRGCGFIKFEKASSCLHAIKEMHQSQTMEGCNSPMVVKFADTPGDKQKRLIDKDTREVKRPYIQQQPAYPASYPQPTNIVTRHESFNPDITRPASYSTSAPTNDALLNTFTPLLNTLSEQISPSTTQALVKSLQIAVNALNQANTTSAQTALVSIASNLSVAVANSVTKPSSQMQVQNYSSFSQEGYNSTQGYDYSNFQSSTARHY